MLLLTRACPAYFRLRALFEASDISTTSEPTVPSGIVSFGPADPVCANHLSCKGLAYSTTRRQELTLAQLWSLEDFVFGEDFDPVLANQIWAQLGIVCDASHLLHLDCPDDVALVNPRAHEHDTL